MAKKPNSDDSKRAPKKADPQAAKKRALKIKQEGYARALRRLGKGFEV
jgi:hypothetical protein